MDGNNQVWLTTLDNPFDYFTDFEHWWKWDQSKGYRTCERLAKLTGSTNNLSDEEAESAITDAVMRLYQLDILGIYRLVYDKNNAA